MPVQTFNLFNFNRESYKITKPVRLIELFGGIGAQAKAFERLGFPFEHWKLCEWNYYSMKAYNAIHIKDWKDYSEGLTKEEMIERINGVSLNWNEPVDPKTLEKKPIEWIKDVYNNAVATHNLINIMNVHGSDLEIKDTDKYDYVLCYSFPCQDLSLAGSRKLMSVSQKDGGTRSGLLWEVERILDELNREREHSTLPQILLMENVPQVIGAGAVQDFNKWCDKLESLGYSNFFQILNSKDYGIPQNRKRCFMVSILGDYSYEFPLKQPLKIKLEDLLEEEVDAKYYLSDKMISYLLAEDTGKYKRKEAFEYSIKETNENGVAVSGTITTRVSASNNTYVATNKPIKIKNATEKGYLEAEPGDGIDISTRMHMHRGTVQKGISQTLTTMGGDNIGVLIKKEK